MDKLAVLQQKHPGKAIARIKTQGAEYFVHAPSREHWHRFVDQLADSKRAQVAMENLAKLCAVEPNAEQLDAIFQKKPGLAAKLAEAIGKLAGVDDAAEIESFDPA